MAIAAPDFVSMPVYVQQAESDRDYFFDPEQMKTRIPRVIAEKAFTDYARQFMEHHFALIGRGNGPFATSTGRLGEIQFWRTQGADGAAWLILQLDRNLDIAKSWGISDILSAMGTDAVGEIIDQLAGPVDTDAADALLRALINMPPHSLPRDSKNQLNGILPHFLAHEDDSVRLNAAAATVMLDTTAAMEMLEYRIVREPEQEVRRTLQVILDGFAQR